MNGGFRVRPDGQFVSNSLNSGTAQKGGQEAGKTNEAPGTGAQTNQSAGASPLPSISLPKGGGAIRGMGEKFAANPVTGTGSLSIPIFTSPGRSGFGPGLSLSYDSGSGNGPFGYGWSLSLPSITRKTDKGLPKYQDDIESDVFILSGAEDLVPVLEERGGQWVRKPMEPRTINGKTYRIDLYRPRIEGLFARIECWTSEAGNVHWRSISKDNILTIYGRDEKSRIADPSNKSRIFSWLICESYDDKGNAIVYDYEGENEKGIELSQTNESNRLRTANQYLKRIRYGNRKPLLLDTTLPGFRGSHIIKPDFASADWMFEVVFDYEEGHYKELQYDNDPSKHRFIQASSSASGIWKCRPDPFSTYRAGFEVRTYHRCHRVLMFHHFDELFQNFPDLKNEPYLVRSTDFDYSDIDYSKPVDVETELKYKGSTRFASFIQKVTQSGYVRDESMPLSELNGARYLTYLKKSLPPLEFDYSQAIIQEKIEEIDAMSLENMPYGLDGARYQWVDLDGEGVSGILTEQAEAWFYKPNLGGGRFGAMDRVAAKPSLASLSDGSTQLLDLAGDGQLDVAEFGGTVPGFYERTHDQNWENFIPFPSLPNLSWKDPNLKFVDLTGDGHADVMITEDEVFTWYPSLAEEGFGPSEMVRQVLDEEKGPRLVFDDGTQSIYLADFSGDGLTDLVRICNGEVCYWPNLGYGRFGSKVTMDDSPCFDYPDMFDQKRIRLADVDGSGVTDIIYLGHNGASIYFNHSGNSWSSAQILASFPHIDNLSSVQVTDLFGNGTACMVWSSPLPGDTSRPMLYIDLMGGQKPHLMVNSKNNMGAETVVKYAASTKFYLEDKARGKPWITRIPFPVHVVERVETHDHISQNRFVTHYAYHHGYFDGVEREFRGFGMVEQWDTGEFAVLGASNILPSATNIDKASHVPPVLTKTWFHTGAYFEGETISRHFEDEYYREGDPSLGEGELSDDQLEAMLLPDTVLQYSLTAEESREASRSLKGSILRQEVYALDRQKNGKPTEESDRPYTISERNYTMERLQPRGENKHAVFFVHPRETIDFHYERKLVDIGGQKLADPRVSHQMTLKVDDFGNVERSVAIGYPRRDVPDRLPEQKETHITLTVNRFINSPEQQDWYRAGLPAEAQTYEIVNPPEPAVLAISVALFKLETIRTLTEGLFGLTKVEPDISKTLSYEKWNWRTDPSTSTGTRLRLIERVRTLYRKNNLTGFLPFGSVESLALPGESYKLAFTPGLILSVYQRKLNNQKPENLLPDPSTILGFKGSDRGGYVDLDGNGNWWLPSGHVFFDIQADQGNPAATATAELKEASGHFFLPRKFTDPFGYSGTVDYDHPHDMLIVWAKDAVDNVIRAENHYRVLQPYLVTDPNDNRSKVIFDVLGMVAGTAIMGKAIEPDGKPKGDSLDGFEPDLTQAQIDAFMAKPREPGANPSEGAATQIVHDLLGKATSRIIYDIDRFKRMGEPPFAAAIARETHSTDLQQGQKSRLQISLSYSDGFGREIQKKIQAEPGPLTEGGPIVNPRWVGSGWTIFNNKGKPVKKYEPFFSATHLFEFAKIVGVSSTLFYDPVERVVITLHPNNTYEKVVFDPWHQKTYDVNDTLIGDPRTDPDISGYVVEYFKQVAPQPNDWKTWLAQRGVDPLAPPHDSPGLDPEKKAAVRTLLHANTPTTAFFDSLGRVFLTILHNRFERNTNGTVVIVDEKYRTRAVFDIEGNQREVRDERKNDQGNTEERIVMRYDYDMLGNRIRQASMEAGERWMLSDVAGKPIRAWDSRGHNFRMEYDPLRRLLHQCVRGTDANRSDPRTLNTWVLFAKTEYGENQTKDKDLNLRTRVFKSYDGAGIATKIEYDFKGNLLRSTRELAKDYINIINWSTGAETEGTFSSSTIYDALNRPIQIVAPHRTGTKLNMIQPVYNEANLLEREDVWLEQAAEPAGLLDPNTASQHAVTNIDYNEKGQRVLIQYGNGAETRYSYDRETFRLIHLYTRRSASFTEDCGGDLPPRFPAPEKPLQGKPCGLQNIHYTYDPAGNIIVIRDDAQQTIYFNGQVIRPDAEYTYDAIYRLIEASSREHPGQASQPQTTWNDESRINLAHPNNVQAMRNYSEFYEYDEAGNIQQINHQAKDGNWIRTYKYNEDSLIKSGTLIEPERKSNRLSHTIVHPDGMQIMEPYTYDPHGNMTSMPHLPGMVWDFKDQLEMVDKGGGCKAYYVYDASGQRVRKVLEQNGTRMNERMYLGGFEIYRKYSAGDTLERETLHIMDDGQRIALVETRTLDTAKNDLAPPQLIRYQFGNHLGSASLELNDKGNVISYEEYYPYGSTSYQAVDQSIKAAAKRYRYTGKERDEETGFTYHGARYYAPWLGRWVSCDPASIRVGFNLYTYVLLNPIGFFDPDGNQEKSFGFLPDALTKKQITQIMGESKDLDDLKKRLGLQGSTNGILSSYLVSKGFTAPAQEHKPNVPDEGYAVRPGRKEDEIVGRIISFPHPSGVGANNRYVTGTKEQLDELEYGQAMQGREQILSGLSSAVAGVGAGQQGFSSTSNSRENQPYKPSTVSSVPKSAPKAGSPPPTSPPSGQSTGGAARANDPEVFTQPGKWENVTRGDSKALAMQAIWSGKPYSFGKGSITVTEYNVKGVRFDRASHDQLGHLKSLDEFKWTYEGSIASGNEGVAKSLRDQASTQIRIADELGVPLEWHVRKDEIPAFKKVLGPDIAKHITFVPYGNGVH